MTSLAATGRGGITPPPLQLRTPSSLASGVVYFSPSRCIKDIVTPREWCQVRSKSISSALSCSYGMHYLTFPASSAKWRDIRPIPIPDRHQLSWLAIRPRYPSKKARSPAAVCRFSGRACDVPLTTDAILPILERVDIVPTPFAFCSFIGPMA